MGRRGVLLGLLGFIGFAALIFLAYAWEPELPPTDPPHRQAFPAADIEHGARLAAIGNCAVCHTRPDGEANAGGRALETPFGTVHSTNITPDVETGIGSWSFDAFTRAMRRGVDRNGRHLYPAFPYDHFTLVSETDNRALYAFLMSRNPVRAQAPANDLMFPLNYRVLIAGWKFLYLKEGEYRPDPSKGMEWNRGAYLAEGLGHCGGCHTPRGGLGAEDRKRHFAGGEAEGWVAYPINEHSPAPVRWTAETLHFYLRHGWHPEHGISRGPMAPVTTNLGVIADEDVRAIAVYVADRMGDATKPHSLPKTHPGNEPSAGKVLFDAACASCHDGSRRLPFGGIDLRLSTAVHASDPTNIINVILQGLPPASGERSPIMPSYHAVISDEQIVDLLTHMRLAFTNKPAWPDLPPLVAKQRAKADTMPMYATDGNLSAPARPSERVTSW